MTRQGPIRLALGAFAVLVAAGVGSSLRAADGQAQAAAALYEIRSYHFQPEALDEYRQWAEQVGLPHLRANLDVVGFWIDTGIPAEVRGEPMGSLGSSNITWIIRWESKAQRDEVMGQVFSTPEWGEIFGQLEPGLAGYLRTESQFFEAL